LLLPHPLSNTASARMLKGKRETRFISSSRKFRVKNVNVTKAARDLREDRSAVTVGLTA
jgi:hypothetical protein